MPPYVWGGAHAFVGLATPGDAGSWQKDSKVNISNHILDIHSIVLIWVMVSGTMLKQSSKEHSHCYGVAWLPVKLLPKGGFNST